MEDAMDAHGADAMEEDDAVEVIDVDIEDAPDVIEIDDD